MKLTDANKKMIGWAAIAVVLTLLSVGLGVSFPIPDPPDFGALGVGEAAGTTVAVGEGQVVVVTSISGTVSLVCQGAGWVEAGE